MNNTNIELVPTKATWLERQDLLRAAEWELHLEFLAHVRRALNSLRRGNSSTSMTELVRLAEFTDKLGRLATGLGTDKQEVTVDTNNSVQIEIREAIRKIYGTPSEESPLPTQLTAEKAPDAQ